ncbi:unnamed protein product [Symbiodinium sp. CCMP2592]|nr:unnamed protein product [Symbiodinium sp. CCMP2592]
MARQPETSREERDHLGLVRFHRQPKVPVAGGICWKAKTGQFLKNQAYYHQRPKVNLWDVPAHAGLNTWKERIFFEFMTSLMLLRWQGRNQDAQVEPDRSSC